MGEITLPLRDRHHAGRVLAMHLAHYTDQDHLLVVGLPRGGIPVAFEVAQALKALPGIARGGRQGGLCRHAASVSRRWPVVQKFSTDP